MKTFAEPSYVLENRRRRAAATQRTQPCGAGTSNGQTCGNTPAALYPRGHRCPNCATAEGLVVGRAPGAYPEHLQQRREAGQYRTASMPTISDQRAEASGKRDPNRAARRDGAYLGEQPTSIDERFAAFDATNPHVRERLVELIEQHVTSGARRLGIGALFEQLRGHVETNGNRYALDNSLRAPYVRALIADRPEWAPMFELRERKTA